MDENIIEYLNNSWVEDFNFVIIDVSILFEVKLIVVIFIYSFNLLYIYIG